ncbi:MAG: hypothetical protein BZY79_00025 [SAR202 cluster bacterium Casp-Chloro-G4]|nr:MAG: hypothetical protein BZY79_00025 [SAR202 cluster bacterium Casp-Chloro-G4]
MRGIGPLELIIVLVIVMMIFGVGKLPQVGQTMGKAIREFRKSQNEDDEAPAPAVSEAVVEKSEEKAPNTPA